MFCPFCGEINSPELVYCKSCQRCLRSPRLQVKTHAQKSTWKSLFGLIEDSTSTATTSEVSPNTPPAADDLSHTDSDEPSENLGAILPESIMEIEKRLESLEALDALGEQTEIDGKRLDSLLIIGDSLPTHLLEEPIADKNASPSKQAYKPSEIIAASATRNIINKRLELLETLEAIDGAVEEELETDKEQAAILETSVEQPETIIEQEEIAETALEQPEAIAEQEEITETTAGEPETIAKQAEIVETIVEEPETIAEQAEIVETIVEEPETIAEQAEIVETIVEEPETIAEQTEIVETTVEEPETIAEQAETSATTTEPPETILAQTETLSATAKQSETNTEYVSTLSGRAEQHKKPNFFRFNSATIWNRLELMVKFLFGATAIVLVGLLAYAYIIEPEPPAPPSDRAILPCVPIMIDGKYGFIDTSGTITIKPVYEFAAPFHEGLAAVKVTHDKQTLWGYINREGTLIIPPHFAWTGNFSNGVAVIGEKHGDAINFGYINAKGAYALSPNYTQALPFNEDVALVSGNTWGGRWAYVHKDGTLLSKLLDTEEIMRGDQDNPRYPIHSDGLLAYSHNGRWGFRDINGNIVIYPRYNMVGDFHDGLASFNTGHKTGFINKNGKIVIPAEYDHAWRFSEGLAAVAIGKEPADTRWGFINTQGTLVITMQFPYHALLRNPHAPIVEPIEFHEGLAAVNVGTAEKPDWGYINTDGVFVILPQFTTAGDFRDGTAEISIGKKRSYINRMGKTVQPANKK